MNKLTNKQINKNRKYSARKNRVNTILKDQATHPRLIVNKSNKYNYAQIVDLQWKVIASANDLKITGWTKKERAKQVWQNLAKAALKNWVTTVSFDRNGYLYHWRVQEIADWARSEWLKF